jgi:NADH dehydrogenase FAD-containing subunit
MTVYSFAVVTTSCSIDLLGAHTHFVSGDVTEVTPTGVHVHGWSAPLPYHYLVLATGSSYAFPGKLALVDRRAAENLYKSAADELKRSRRCVIVGGGPCGVELAGEVEEMFRIANDADLKAYEQGIIDHKVEPRTVTLIQRNSRLNVNFPVEVSTMCCDKLRARGVNVMLNTEALLPQATLDAYHTNKVSYVSGHQVIPTSVGIDIKSDLMFLCAGYVPSFLSCDMHCIDGVLCVQLIVLKSIVNALKV